MGASVRLLDYGVCQPINESMRVQTASLSGYFLEADSLRFTDRTEQVALRKGLTIGIRYQLISTYDPFISRIRHPALVHPKTKRSSRETIDYKYLGGDGVGFDYYCFEHSWEMIAGTWTFDVILSDQLLLSKSFFLYC